MGTFRGLVREAAESLGLTYIYGSWARINKDLDAFAAGAGDGTAVLHIEHTQGSVELSTSYSSARRTSEQMSIGLGRAIEFDYDSGEVGDIVDSLIAEGLDLIGKINASGQVEEVTSVSYQVLYDRFDANLVVVMFTLTLTGTEAVC